MLEKIATYIDHHRLFPESGTIIVAVSGGADSLCLLHVLNRLCGSRPEARYPAVRLHVAHLNHKLRGEASYQDRKSTRLNSSHPSISYAVFCLKKKKKIKTSVIHTHKYMIFTD